jgi:hypothetical protein
VLPDDVEDGAGDGLLSAPAAGSARSAPSWASPSSPPTAPPSRTSRAGYPRYKYALVAVQLPACTCVSRAAGACHCSSARHTSARWLFSPGRRRRTPLLRTLRGGATGRGEDCGAISGGRIEESAPCNFVEGRRADRELRRLRRGIWRRMRTERGSENETVRPRQRWAWPRSSQRRL